MQFAPEIEGLVPVQPGSINADVKTVQTIVNIKLLFILNYNPFSGANLRMGTVGCPTILHKFFTNLNIPPVWHRQ